MAIKEDSLKIVVNNPEVWMILSSHFEALLDNSRKYMERADETTVIFRQQGKIEVLKELLGLWEKVNGRREPTRNQGIFE